MSNFQDFIHYMISFVTSNCRIKLYGGNTVGRWNWKRNQYLAVFNFIWLGAQYRPTMAHRHAISLYPFEKPLINLIYILCLQNHS